MPWIRDGATPPAVGANAGRARGTVASVRAPRVLVVGSANIDYVVSAPRLPAPGETVTGGTLLVNHGGKGANQAVAARRLGAEVRFIGCVGDDAAGAAIRARLAAEGIGVAGMFSTAEAATGTALIVVDPAGRNQIAVAPGANHRVTIEMVAARRDDVAWAQVVLCPLELPPPTVAWTLKAARSHGALTIFNPAPVQPLPDEVWPQVDYLTPNEGEAGRLTGGLADPGAAAAALLARGVGTVVVTLGATGALACSSTTQLRVAAPAVTAIDTTGAGDAFNGALAVALGEGRPLVDALRFATAAGALTCTRRGAQDALPTRVAVEALPTEP
jgi:ribokinase